jgi:drug/metabolite transporter (DMT)-like permease
MSEPASIRRSMTALEWALLLGLSVLWACSFFFNAVALKEISPLTVALLRVAFAAVILLVALRAIGIKMPADRRIWAAFFGMGFLNNALPFGLIVWGQTHIASGLASILNATTPLATVLVAHFLTADEKMSGNRLAGVIIGLLGVVVMIGPEVLQGFGVNVAAQLACLAAALSYAFAGVFGRRFKRLGIAPMVTATGQAIASTVILLPIALTVEHPWALAMPSMAAWGAIAGIALLSTALGYVIYFRILATAGATNLLLVTFLIPVSAILLGSLVLGERLDAKHFAGMALIGAGLLAIDGRVFARLRRAGESRSQP